MQEFYIGQVFEGKYPPESAVWCNRNNAHIENTGEKKEITITEEYTVLTEEERVDENGETVIVPVEKTETRTVKRIVSVYKIVANPAPPEVREVRIFSKYKLCETAMAIPFTLADGTVTTVWEAFKSFITAAGKKDLWDNINEVAENNPHFLEALPIAIENFGTDLVERILAAATERIETQNI